MKFILISLKLITVILLFVPIGCSRSLSPAATLSGGMTSGGWGETGQGTFATCSVNVTREVSREDRKLSRARISLQSIGAAQWYSVSIGDEQNELDSFFLEGKFHKFASPLMLDGRWIPISAPAPADLPADQEVGQTKFVGDISLTATDDTHISGSLSWVRTGHSRPTIATATEKNNFLDLVILKRTILAMSLAPEY